MLGHSSLADRVPKSVRTLFSARSCPWLWRHFPASTEGSAALPASCRKRAERRRQDGRCANLLSDLLSQRSRATRVTRSARLQRSQPGAVVSTLHTSADGRPVTEGDRAEAQDRRPGCVDAVEPGHGWTARARGRLLKAAGTSGVNRRNASIRPIVHAGAGFFLRAILSAHGVTALPLLRRRSGGCRQVCESGSV